MSNNLTYYERMMLAYWLRTRLSLRKIGTLVGRDHTVLSREIRRNGGSRKRYQPDRAEGAADKRRQKKRRGKLEMHPALKAYVLEKLQDEWSPEQIAGRLKEKPPPHLHGITISHESIYHYLYERRTVAEKRLVSHLRQAKACRTRRGTRRVRTKIRGRISIHDRPDEINERTRYGDWESDSVEGKRPTKTGLSVQYERKSQLTRITKIPNLSAEETTNAIIRTAETLPEDWFHSITFDNGKENYGHHTLKDLYDIETYFCDPFSSWQKGGVENMNKLIRQYIPKRTNISLLTERDIAQIEYKLNNRPRKKLNYKTPNEILEEWKSGALLT